MNSSFYTTQNMQLLINIFKDYMSEKFNVSNYDSDENIRKILLTIMTDVQKNSTGSLQDLNIQALAKVKDFYCTKLQLNSARQNKPNVENLNRDKSIYGNRPLKQNIIIPEPNPYQKKTAELNEKDMMDRMITDRNNDIYPKQQVPDFQQIAPVTKEISQNQDEFMKRLQDLQDERNKMQVDVNIQRPVIAPNTGLPDPAALFRDQLSTKNLSIAGPSGPIWQQNSQDTNIRTQAFSDGMENIVIPKTFDSIKIKKYLSINSVDRDWSNGANPYRYKYGVNFLSKDNDIANKYKNIESIQVGKVIVPCETSLSTNTSFHISFSLPYVVLSIDEFQDVYDGTNDTIRKSFCNLIYESSYRAPNGRGYIVLKPIQKEKKQFYPAPLSTIQKLSISLLKPNGDLFSNHQDSYKILTIEQDSNPNRLLITLNAYFEQAEFYNSDFILIQNFVVSKLVPQQLDSDINGINEFINRPNGHEIISIGTANGNGYYNSFYISSPGAFDNSTGAFNLQTSIINCLNYFNLNNTSTQPNGNVLNQSLQHSISLQVETIVDNAKILDTQSVFSF
jgi:hypothetical protein